MPGTGAKDEKQFLTSWSSLAEQAEGGTLLTQVYVRSGDVKTILVLESDRRLHFTSIDQVWGDLTSSFLQTRVWE